MTALSESLQLFLSSHGIPDWGVIFIISMMPIFELRLGLITAAILKVPVTRAFWICLAGNLLPIPFILLFIKAVFNVLRKHRWCGKIINKLESLALKKSESIKKRVFIGLFLFVAVPLPGTGGWTGALIAALLNMDIKKSFIAISAGVAGAGLIMITLAYFIPGMFGLVF